MGRVSAAELRRSGMIAGGQFPRSAFNLHNQGVERAQYQGPRGSGFAVEFLGEKARQQLDHALFEGVAVVRSSAIEAVVSSTDTIKQKMRTYLDGHFRGSAMHGNAHRRASNAMVQSAYFNDLADKGQVTALIYSKFGFRNAGGFVDFLLLHMRGGEIKPTTGEWLRIPGRERFSGSRFGGARINVGEYDGSGSSIHWAKSKDGAKLFLLRTFKGGKKTELLETLVKSLRIEPSLQGLEGVMATYGPQFESDFSAAFSRRESQAKV